MQEEARWLLEPSSGSATTRASGSSRPTTSPRIYSPTIQRSSATAIARSPRARRSPTRLRPGTRVRRPSTSSRSSHPAHRLRRIGAPTGPEAYVVPNLRGGRMARQRVGEIVTEAAAEASETLRARGLPSLPRVTPHSLRRTYISIALLANNFDVKWVMSQVGHADSKMTLDVYAQLEQRAKRDHGASFDRLIRRARDLNGESPTASEAGQLG